MLCRAFRNNPAMEELVLPTSITREEVECVQQLCKEMGLGVELGDKVSSCCHGY